MATVNQPLKIEDLQLSAQGLSRVVTVKPGQEAAAASLAASSGADALSFTLGGDQMILAGRGLSLKGVYKGTAVSLNGQSGVVNADGINRPNTFAEGFTKTAPRGLAIYGTGGAVAGYVLAGIAGIMSPFSWATVLTWTGGGLAVGLGLATLAGFWAAAKRVDLNSFSEVQK